MKKSLDIIVPVYNEADNLIQLHNRIESAAKNQKKFSIRVIFINDGSNDGSCTILKSLKSKYFDISIINFTRNFGHQIAVTAGLDHAAADFIAIIDADLQDPPELIFPMLEQLCRDKVDIVFGRRKSRAGESVFKRLSAYMFYRLLRFLSSVDIPQDVGDFRVFTREVLNSITTMRERNRFLRGMFAWLGYESSEFLYDRDPRFAGGSKYSLIKMISLALAAAISMSDNPMRFVIRGGVITFIVVVAIAIYVLVQKVVYSAVVPGITSVLLLIGFIGSVQIITLGMIGSYVVRVFDEVKVRPLYVVKNDS